MNPQCLRHLSLTSDAKSLHSTWTNEQKKKNRAKEHKNILILKCDLKTEFQLWFLFFYFGLTDRTFRLINNYQWISNIDPIGKFRFEFERLNGFCKAQPANRIVLIWLLSFPNYHFTWQYAFVSLPFFSIPLCYYA